MIPEKLVKAGLVFPPFLILDQSRMLVELLPNTGMMVEVTVKIPELVARSVFITAGQGLGGRCRNRKRKTQHRQRRNVMNPQPRYLH